MTLLETSFLRGTISKLVFLASRFFRYSSRAKPCYVPMNSVELESNFFFEKTLYDNDLSLAFFDKLASFYDLGCIEGSFKIRGTNSYFLKTQGRPLKICRTKFFLSRFFSSLFRLYSLSVSFLSSVWPFLSCARTICSWSSGLQATLAT